MLIHIFIYLCGFWCYGGKEGWEGENDEEKVWLYRVVRKGGSEAADPPPDVSGYTTCYNVCIVGGQDRWSAVL